MQWLIAALREPVAELAQAALTAVAATVALRIRGRVRRVEARQDERLSREGADKPSSS